MNSRNMGSRNLSFAATARIRWKRRDVQLYIQRMKETKAPLLSSISNGVHTHLVETETEEEMKAIHRALEKLGILVK